MLQSLAKEFSERSHQNESSIERLYDGIAQTQQLLVRLEGALLGTVGDSVWEALGQDVRETRAKVLDQTSDSNKAFNQELNHLTRSVERTLHNDSLASFRQSSSVTEKMIEDSLAVAIAEFLFRHKSCHLAERFCHEAQLVEQCKELKAKFSFLSKVTDSIREGSVALALDWLSQVSNDECDRLRFSLHCLAFLPLVLAGDSLKCLQYARENLSPFYATVCLSQLQQLMGTLAWKSSKIEKHPRAPQLLDVKGKTEDCVREFTSFYCQQARSLVIGCRIEAGASGIPSLLRVMQLIRDKKVEWSQKSELPIETPIPSECTSPHSIFVCPVLKVQCTEENPPMCLPCGHIVSKEALVRLSRSHQNVRFKCPYCPAECSFAQAIVAYF